MRDPKFEYGPVFRGIYYGLISVCILIFQSWPDYAIYYGLMLIFLGFGLRPFIERSGIYDVYVHFAQRVRDRWNHNFVKQRREEVDRNTRDERYRKARYKDTRLPKDW